MLAPRDAPAGSGQSPLSDATVRSLARSAVHINLLQAWQIVARLVQMPVVLAAIGLDGYGVWALLYSLCSYPALLNTGVVWAYVKVTAELDARREYALLSEVVSTGVVLATLLSLVALGVLWALRDVALPLLGVGAPVVREAEWTLAVLALSVLVDAAGCWGLHVLAGLQRMDLQYRLLTLGSMLESGVSIALLLAGRGLIGLAIGVLANRVFCAVASRALSRAQRPGLRVTARRVSGAGLRPLLRLGMGFQSVALLGTATRETLRLSISALFGTVALGTYQLADRLLWMAGSPAHAFIAPLMPAFAGLHGAADRLPWVRLLQTSSRLVAAAAALPLGFAALFADSILFAWTGGHYPDAVWTARMLAFGEGLAALTAVRAAALRASGAFGREIRYQLLEGSIALAGVAGGAALASYRACVLAITSARGAAALWFLRRTRPAGGRYVAGAGGASLPTVRGTEVLAPLGAAALALGAAYGLAQGSPAYAAAQVSRAWTLVVLVALAALSAGIAAAAWVLANGIRRRMRR